MSAAADTGTGASFCVPATISIDWAPVLTPWAAVVAQRPSVDSLTSGACSTAAKSYHVLNSAFVSGSFATLSFLQGSSHRLVVDVSLLAHSAGDLRIDRMKISNLGHRSRLEDEDRSGIVTATATMQSLYCEVCRLRMS